ncbi:hypothetical protein KVR01_009477 [Diaporthe batatas]|uniref:uncharacterized protein n=1 Tax=Diaporthe batatas TaxID=748121 RepID=UPI001D038838|nr:uncharacterized protein KVR01_009477 [Diaporthe batatas]KAG8161213.1 hypothetical protein KVR01_009477 [Diaporthe batatas]
MSPEPVDHNNNQQAPEMDLARYTQDLVERFSQPIAMDVVFWSPPEDPDKPSLPYLPGFNTTIYAHQVTGTEKPRPYLEDEYLRTATQSEAVVEHPSRFAPSIAVGTSMAKLVITSCIASGATKGPQIVACMITPCQKDGEEPQKSFQAVAKIYDPLYYSFLESLGRQPRDCVNEADKDYTNEVAAYEQLRRHGQTGSFAPEYHGSWTFTLPVTVKGNPQRRDIHLVLIELLNGVSIQDTQIQNSEDKSKGLDSFHFPEEYRLEILARAMDGYVKQLKIGLDQRDFAGRNVMLVSDKANPQGEEICGLTIPRVVLVDYNIAKVANMSLETRTWLPSNPAAVFWDQCLWEDFNGWVPNQWQDWKLQQDWLLWRFNGENHRHLYYPSQEFFDQMLAARTPIDG